MVIFTHSPKFDINLFLNLLFIGKRGNPLNFLWNVRPLCLLRSLNVGSGRLHLVFTISELDFPCELTTHYLTTSNFHLITLSLFENLLRRNGSLTPPPHCMKVPKMEVLGVVQERHFSVLSRGDSETVPLPFHWKHFMWVS